MAGVRDNEFSESPSQLSAIQPTILDKPSIRQPSIRRRNGRLSIPLDFFPTAKRHDS